MPGSLALAWLATAACTPPSADDAVLARFKAHAADEAAPERMDEGRFDKQGARAPAAAKPSKKRMALEEETVAGSVHASGMITADSPADDAFGGGGDPGASAEQAEVAPTRSWFPETFLFEPLVVTGEDGRAEVPAVVPDRLTTWRVLGLAHSRAGAQAGAVTTFQSQLPVSLDPVLPGFLTVGDDVALPIPVLNTTDEEVRGELVASVKGAKSPAAGQRLVIPAHGSTTAFVPITATRPGLLELGLTFGAFDKVERTLEVRSGGRPDRREASGSLAAPRDVTLSLPPAVEEGSAQVRLTVFPGALGILRSELAAAPGRGSPDDDAYLLLLAGRARELSEALRAPVDDAGLARLRRLAAQRVIRRTRSPSDLDAARFVGGAFAHAGDPLLTRLAERLAAQVARGQRVDGTFFGQNGWPLQRLVVATAEGIRAVDAGAASPAGARRAQAARLRAKVAFERFLPRVDDAYTAAAVLASSTLDEKAARPLVERVQKAVVRHDDGSASLPVGPGVVTPDGSPPSEVEATALAVLALQGEPTAKDLLKDLGAFLLGHYRTGSGFGNGRSNRLALEAVALLFSDPLPAEVVVRVEENGTELLRGTLSGARLREALTLSGPLDEKAGPRRVRIVAEPPVPGLGYQLQLRFTEPWPPADPAAGVELEVTPPPKPRVGSRASVAVQAAVPGGRPFTLRVALPAGAQPDLVALDRLQNDGVFESFEHEDGALTLRVGARRQGALFSAALPVVPSLSGRLVTGASVVTLPGGREISFPGRPWTVGR